MIQVRCLLCLTKEQERLETLADQENWTAEKLQEKLNKAEEMMGYDIQSKVIAKNEQENLQLLGQELIAHLGTVHRDEAKALMELSIMSNGFQLMKFFETKDEESMFEKEKEKMREKIMEETLKFAPDVDDDEIDELEEEDDCDDDEDDEEEEDEEFEDEDEDSDDPLEDREEQELIEEEDDDKESEEEED